MLWEAQVENLELALPAVEEYLTTVEGKHVVSSDHGQLNGERGWPFPIRMWGHPRTIYKEELVKVPWLVYQNGSRRIVTDGVRENEITQVDEEEVEQRLQDLGYQ